MFDYYYDSESGGLNLSFNNGAKSIRSARPVFAEEMVMYGFDRYFKFDPDEKRPYMWVELNSYYYRGVKIARVTGGDLNSDPVLTVYKDLLTETELTPIDVELMNKKNDEQLNFLYATTIARLEAFVSESISNVDRFFVSYSGGKDSDVVLDLIAQSRYAHDVGVIFCDTDMEALETYKHVVQVARRCEDLQIPFHFAGSHLNSFDSWRLFSPPSRKCRWCCTVHKSTPIALRMKSIGTVGKAATFVGVRWEESPKRRTYEFVSDGFKVNGQVVFYPILDWSLAELWTYILWRNVFVCKLYRYGFRRIGCLVCSQSAGRSDWVSKYYLDKQIEPYKKLIINTDVVVNPKSPDSYWKTGGWHNRRNGFYVRGNRKRKEYAQTETHYLVRTRFAEDSLVEWRKIVGGKENREDGSFVCEYFGEQIVVETEQENEWTVYKIPRIKRKIYRQFLSDFKKLIDRVCYCVGCRSCEVECEYNAITFSNGKVKIDNCRQCRKCLNSPSYFGSGCVRERSLSFPVTKSEEDRELLVKKRFDKISEGENEEVETKDDQIEEVLQNEEV